MDVSGFSQQPLSQPFQPGGNQQQQQVRDRQDRGDTQSNTVQAPGTQAAETQSSENDNSESSASSSQSVAFSSTLESGGSQTPERGSLLDISV